MLVSIGRGGGIRTRDPLHPMQVRYQAALRPDEPRIIPSVASISKAQKVDYALDFSLEANGSDGFAFLNGLDRATFVEPVARPADGKALVIKQFTNSAHQQNFVVLVVAAVTPALDRLQLIEFLFPVAQHVWLDATELAHFTNGEIALGGDRRQVFAAAMFTGSFHRATARRRTSAFDWHGR